jgi:hypothetical protein
MMQEIGGQMPKSYMSTHGKKQKANNDKHHHNAKRDKIKEP